jgi:2-polyprenyl-3-methyl-5-hydroxy-6-metoxy-1,4-benzoquinol methylase
MHNEGKFPGHSLNKYTDDIKKFYRLIGGGSILDYGCGKAVGWNRMKRELDYPLLTLYDPAFKPYENKPTTQFDMVICTDVMEHIPEEDVMDVLKDIFSFARKGVFLGVSTKLANKLLPDGRNAHLTVKPASWWEASVYGLDLGVRWEIAFD